jgi:hypothetical protein
LASKVIRASANQLSTSSTWCRITTTAASPRSPSSALMRSVAMSKSILLNNIIEQRQPLLANQVIYKIATPFIVGTFSTPVVISNLEIAVLDLVTL